MADYYNISQLIEICPGSLAQMSLSESGSPWANIPTAPSAGCVHLTRKKRSLQHVSHCVGQERTGVLHLQVAVIEPNGLFYELTLAAAVSQWRVYFYHFLYFRRKPKSVLFLLEFLP